MPFTPAHADFYEKNGYVVVEGLISKQDLATVRQHVDDLQQTILEQQAARKAEAKVGYLTEGGGTAVAAKPALRKLSELAPVDPLFRRIASTPEILDIVSALTGGGRRIMLYSDQIFLKPAFCGSEKPLHQDNSYFKVTPHIAGITCWMALDDATIENGCMNYIPGSHKLGMISHKAIKDTPHLVPDGSVKLDVEVPVPIPAGACIFHHLLCLHSSKANSSPNPRRAYALHYANRNAESCVRPWNEMLALRE
jgi:phytanoyl-CoA hydroxylase